MADLLKSRVEKALGPNPLNDDPNHVRRFAEQRFRRVAPHESDQDRPSWSTQVIAVLGSLTAEDIALSAMSTI